MTMPAALLAALQGGNPPPGADQGGPPPPPDQAGQGGQDPLAALQQVIQDLHELIGILPDPGHTQTATQCLLALTKIQKDLMPQQPSGMQGAMMNQLGKGGQ